MLTDETDDDMLDARLLDLQIQAIDVEIEMARCRRKGLNQVRHGVHQGDPLFIDHAREWGEWSQRHDALQAQIAHTWNQAQTRSNAPADLFDAPVKAVA
jgi:hypothetical protein